ncbi:hypothetical protein SGPA1_11287 [Streptomyces misionensis JCM 4497]
MGAACQGLGVRRAVHEELPAARTGGAAAAPVGGRQGRGRRQGVGRAARRAVRAARGRRGAGRGAVQAVGRRLGGRGRGGHGGPSGAETHRVAPRPRRAGARHRGRWLGVVVAQLIGAGAPLPMSPRQFRAPVGATRTGEAVGTRVRCRLPR